MSRRLPRSPLFPYTTLFRSLSHAVEHAPPECKFAYEFTCDENLDEKLHLALSTQIQIYRIAQEALSNVCRHSGARDRKSTRLNSSHQIISYAVFCLKKKEDK